MNPYLLEILRHPIDKLAIVTWPDMLIVDANEEFCAHVNQSKSDLERSNLYDLLCENVPREKRESITNQVNTKGFASLVYESNDKIVQWTRIQCDDALYALVRVCHIPTNKKNIENALAESERRFETFALSVTEGVAIVQDGVILDANDQLARIYGKENHQSLHGRHLNELLSETDIQHIMSSAAISAVNRNDVRITDVAGRTTFLEITGSYTDYNRKRALVLVFNDISASKRNEQALQQSLLSFQRLLEDSPNGVVILTDGRIQYLNQAACKLFAIEDEDEVFGGLFTNFIEESHREAVLNDLQIVRAGGEAPNKEIKLVNAHQLSIEVEIKSTLTVYENKPSIQVTLNNISDRAKLLQEQLRVRFVEEINSALKAEIDEHRATQVKLEQQQRQTLEQTAKIDAIFNSTENLLMWTLDHDFRVTTMNTNFLKEMKSVFGEEVKEGDNIIDILQQHVDDNVYQGQLQSFTNGFKGRPQQFELPLLNGEKQTVWWQCFLNPIYLHGQLEELSCLVYDNTDRKEIDRKVRDSLKEKEVLLQEVHHRVKNNLQVISSILNLQTSYVNDPHTLEILRESQQRIKSMSFIHETIYRTADFSRLEFMDYIKTIASNLIQSYRTVGTNVRFEPEMESVGLNLDQAIPCGLIINELVSNALKYAFKGRKNGHLTILLKEHDQEIQLAVKDDGVGLPKDFAFEKNNSLGIQLVYALIEQLDATMVVNQTNGTEFFIRFRRK